MIASPTESDTPSAMEPKARFVHVPAGHAAPLDLSHRVMIEVDDTPGRVTLGHVDRCDLRSPSWRP